MRRTLALVLGLVLLSGCQDTTQTGNSAAPTKTYTSVNDLTGAVVVAVAKAQQAKVDFEADYGDSKFTGTGAARFTGQGIEAQASATLPTNPGQQAKQSQVVISKENFYLKMPPGSGFGDGSKWLKISANGQDFVSKLLGKTLNQIAGQLDIGKTLQQFGAASTLKGSKDETLSGVQTKHYSLEADVQKLAASSTDPLVKAGYDELVKQGVKTAPLELWLNKDDQPVKFTGSTPLSGGKSGSFTATFKDWGQPVVITVPTDAETTTLGGG
ncbi:hypothetical protein D5S17_06015 [Pseudonocardiaceae bacterium YIM PH 21723]|nr:hypothetical protein D5S17_06015 [Pseudonocardiaceae bacterium YIM PH 21723]